MSRKLALTTAREISSLEIAQALAKSGSKLIEPTDEQRAIIESKSFGPTVIIAGAGSGKTETMSQRVLWLVANGVVKPDEILGLTFTRKAAGELSTRIRKRLLQLRKVGMIPTDPRTGSIAEIAVDVSTYHAYAGRTLSTHGLRMGIDIEPEPLGEAAAWQLTAQVVNSFEVLEEEVAHKPNFIIDAVLKLSAELGEHNKSIEELRRYTEDFRDQLAPFESGKSNDVYRSALAVARERLALLPMVRKVNEKKLELGEITFSDQMAYAAQLVAEFPEIGESEREKYPVVLLDEYQDTSDSQVRFLSSLFGSKNHHITAVGDPNQSIYGWRGASAQTLEVFHEKFKGEASSFTLLTTWRNDHAILELANLTIAQLAKDSEKSQGVNLLKARRDAGAGNLSCGLYVTQREEAAAIANYFAPLWSDPDRLKLPLEKRSTFAVLTRVKSYIPEIESALRERGIKTEVIGVSGLIHLPEIADIIALLRTVTFPDSGTALARLILGPRLALGAHDLAALGEYARAITKESGLGRSKKLEAIIESGDEALLEADDFATGSIIEALENILQAPKSDFSPEGLKRLIQFSEELQEFRREAHGSLTDIIIAAERFLHFDTELLLRDGSESGRRHIDKFLDEAASFARNGGSLASFLDWLDAADDEEGGLKPSEVSASHDAVQILTIHSAKGAEWDVVAIPGLLHDVFPNKGKSDSWIKKSGSLPIALRGDGGAFKDFQFPPAEIAKPSEIRKAIDDFEDEWKKSKYLEELRLGYVAFTRARAHLFLTATVYRDGIKQIQPSVLFNIAHNYLEERSPDSIQRPVEIPPENPNITNPRTAIWPVKNPRADRVAMSARAVIDATPFDFGDIDLPSLKIDELQLVEDSRVILNEFTSRNKTENIYLPERLSVSTLIALQSNPQELALSIRRPMPRHSDKYATRGTEFHLWLERRFESQTLFDDEIFEPEPLEDSSLKELQDRWLASSWANRTPHDVEAGFETVINGIVLRGRIDAIYKEGDQYEIIDWKTGRVKSGEDLESATIQLAMYRLAYSKLHGIPLESIRAGFYYVADDQTVWRASLSQEEEIASLIASIPII